MKSAVGLLLLGSLSVAFAANGCIDLTLDDGSPWHDAYDESSTCTGYYALDNNCVLYGKEYAFEGSNAMKACCACGGGKIVITPSTTLTGPVTVLEGDVVTWTGIGNGVRVVETSSLGGSVISSGFTSGSANSGIGTFIQAFSTAGTYYFKMEGSSVQGTIEVTERIVGESGRCLGTVDGQVWSFFQPNFDKNMDALYSSCTGQCFGNPENCRSCTSDALSSAPFSKVCSKCMADSVQCQTENCAQECSCKTSGSCLDDSACDYCYKANCMDEFVFCSGLNPATSCVPNPDWVDPAYGDTCIDLLPGGKSEDYACDVAGGPENCCVCQKEVTAGKNCPDANSDDPNYSGYNGATCADYAPGSQYHDFCAQDKADENCCAACGAGASGSAGGNCPTPTSDDPTWAGGFQDTGCEAYAKGSEEGYHEYCADDGASENCCASCGSSALKGDSSCPTPTTDDPAWAGGHNGLGCDAYAPGSELNYNAYCDDDGASLHCCAACGGSGTTESFCPSPTTDDASWAGGFDGNGCDVYAPGEQYHQYCDGDGATAYCCGACAEFLGGAETKCPSPNEDDPSWAGGFGGGGCSEYAPGKENHKFCDQDGATKFCCAACSAGSKGAFCPTPTSDDTTWNGGHKGSTCKQYAPGGEYADYCEQDGAEQYCCAACGVGGDVAPVSEFDQPIGANGPFPDLGDKIVSEELGGVTFKNKKHLQGGFVLYWNVMETDQMLQIGLLSRQGVVNGWIGLGFSPTGYMAKSDTVVGWVNSGDAMVDDYYFENQAQSGITLGKRQGVTEKQVFTIDNRLAMTFKRPFTSSSSGVLEVVADQLANIIYATGPYIKGLCSPFCNHDYVDRYMSSVAFRGLSGVSMYDSNKSYKNEPCQGIAGIECVDGLYCFHTVPQNGDNFYYSLDKYGECVDAEELGADTGEEDMMMPWMSPTQTVFENKGGFEYEKELSGGFHVMWTINNKDDLVNGSISMAVISTRSERQGWMGFAFSANGDMAGSDAIIGWDDEAGNNHVGDYFLYGQMTSKVKPNDKQGLENLRVIKKNGQSALVFERPLYPAESVFVMEGQINIIYAAGALPTSKDTLPYHTFRAQDTVAFIALPEEMAKLNGEDEYGLCAGEGNIECKLGLDCQMFPDNIGEIMADRMGSFREDSEEEAESELGDNEYDWGGQKEEETDKEEECEEGEECEGKGKGKGGGGGWSMNADAWVGMGMCQQPGAESMWEVDWSAMMAGSLINKAEWTYNKKLRWGFTMYWRFKKVDTVPYIDIAMVNQWAGGYLAVGIFPTDRMDPGMIGTNAAVGWMLEDGSGNAECADYLLYGKLPWEIMKEGAQMIENCTLSNQGRETMMQFSRPVKPSYYGDENDDRFAINPGDMYVIYSSGNTPNPNAEQDFGYHRFRDMASIPFYENEAEFATL